MPKELNTEKCCCCENDLWDRNKYTLLDQCIVCGMAQAKEIPSEKQLKNFYQKDYYFGEEYVDYIKDRNALEKNFSKRVTNIIELSSKKSNLKVIEIGSAYGFFLNLIKPYSKSMLGFEVGRDQVDYANENFSVNCTTDDFLKRKIENNSQDVIVMWDVIEHLRDPKSYVKKMSECTKKGGLVCLTTGDISAYIARKKGNSWRMIHPPTHLYYFTKKSLEILLLKNGLVPEIVSYDKHYRNFGSVIGMLILDRQRKGRDYTIFKLAEKFSDFTRLSKINFGINTKDIVFIAARKK